MLKGHSMCASSRSSICQLLLVAVLLLASSTKCSGSRSMLSFHLFGAFLAPLELRHNARLPPGCDLDSQLQLWEAATGSEGLPSQVGCVERMEDGCNAKYGAGNYVTLRAGGVRGGGEQLGCLKLVDNGINQACPKDYPFAWYAAPESGSKPHLKECWLDNGGHSSCHSAPFTASLSIAALSSGIGVVNATNLAGCTPAVGGHNAPMQCPSMFPFFAASADGTLPNPTPGHSSCSDTAPVCRDLNKVPVIDSNNPDVSGTTLGCLGTAIQLGRDEHCPKHPPHPAGAVAEYDFFIAAGSNTDGLTASRILECRRKEAASSCGGSLLRVRRHWFRNNPDGCLTGM